MIAPAGTDFVTTAPEPTRAPRPTRSGLEAAPFTIATPTPITTSPSMTTWPEIAADGWIVTKSPMTMSYARLAGGRRHDDHVAPDRRQAGDAERPVPDERPFAEREAARDGSNVGTAHGYERAALHGNALGQRAADRGIERRRETRDLAQALAPGREGDDGDAVDGRSLLRACVVDVGNDRQSTGRSEAVSDEIPPRTAVDDHRLQRQRHRPSGSARLRWNTAGVRR